MAGELVAGTDNIGEFEKKIRGIKAEKKSKLENPEAKEKLKKLLNEKKITKSISQTKFKAKGGRVGLKGGGICKKGMNRKAVGKNS